ncbi:MAG TPA: HlyC/CorC family transporter [Desulfobacterales bacterium]|nr:HlyC/CorC family transporter [Desulfobacterales bacterium]
MTGQLILLICLLVLSGFFSSAETALFSISKTKSLHIAKKGGKPLQLIKKMKDDPHKLLSTILIGNNIVNVGAAVLATSLSMGIFPNHAIGFTTGIMTFFILVFGEVLPKSIATRNNIFIAKIAIFPIYWLSILFFPFLAFLNFIPKLTGRIKKPPGVTEEELMTFVEVVEEEGEIKEEEKELIYNIFELDDTNVSEIMTPRTDMFVVEAEEKLRLDRIIQSGFSRIPVIEENIDHVIGILNIKDLFMHQVSSSKEIDVRKIMTKPYFVPENKKLDNLLHQFKKIKHHMAIVVDEYGGVSGLITLEDTLEEIVGEIRDETDKDEPHIVEMDDQTWMVLGKSEIEEVNEMTGMDIPDSKEYDTFSGFILEKIGRIPKEKEKIVFETFIITVKAMERNRLREFIVKKD